MVHITIMNVIELVKDKLPFASSHALRSHYTRVGLFWDGLNFNGKTQDLLIIRDNHILITTDTTSLINKRHDFLIFLAGMKVIAAEVDGKCILINILFTKMVKLL